jgi:hypothetical protein
VITHTEFRKRLEQLREVIARGSAYWAVSKKLRYHEEGKVSWSLEEQNKIFGEFQGFLTPVALAVLDMAFLELNKVFDADPRTASLLNLLRAARQDAGLVSGRTAEDVGAVSSQLRQSERILKVLKRRRDQQLAHVDANPAPVDPLLVKEFDRLLEDVRSAFSWLSTAHYGRPVSWEWLIPEVEADTSRVMGALLEELNRRDAVQRGIAERSRS